MKRRRVRLAACGTNSLRSSSANASGSPRENCYASSVFEKAIYILTRQHVVSIDRASGSPARCSSARASRANAPCSAVTWSRCTVLRVRRSRAAAHARAIGATSRSSSRHATRYYEWLGDQVLTRHTISRSCLVEIGVTRVTRYYKLRRVQILMRHVISRSRLVKVACIHYYSFLRDQINTQHIISRSCLVEPLAMEPLVLVLVGRHAAVLTVPRRGVGAARWLDAVAGVSSGVVALRHVRGAHIHPRMTELFAVVEGGGSAGGKGGGAGHICACRGLAHAAAVAAAARFAAASANACLSARQKHSLRATRRLGVRAPRCRAAQSRRGRAASCRASGSGSPARRSARRRPRPRRPPRRSRGSCSASSRAGRCRTRRGSRSGSRAARTRRASYARPRAAGTPRASRSHLSCDASAELRTEHRVCQR